MKEFVFLFRQADFEYKDAGPEALKQLNDKWYSWIEGIASQGKLANNGIRLGAEGKVLKAGGLITDGPFVELKEKLGGFIVVKAESLEEATTLAHGCPAIEKNGSVEIRSIYTMA